MGAHMEMEMDGVAETEVYSLSDLSSGAFGWLVPVGSNRVRVGVLALSGAISLATQFLERAEIRNRVRSSLTPLLQRPVPVGGASRTVAHGVISIGDAAGQVKSTTGGGLYFGALAARDAADVLGTALEKDDLSARALMRYQLRWRKQFIQEIDRGMLVRRAYSRMSPQRVDDIIIGSHRPRCLWKQRRCCPLHFLSLIMPKAMAASINSPDRQTQNTVVRTTALYPELAERKGGDTLMAVRVAITPPTNRPRLIQIKHAILSIPIYSLFFARNTVLV